MAATMNRNCRSKCADTDEVEAERAADEVYYGEANDAVEPLAFADGRADHFGDEVEVEEDAEVEADEEDKAEEENCNYEETGEEENWDYDVEVEEEWAAEEDSGHAETTPAHTVPKKISPVSGKKRRVLCQLNAIMELPDKNGNCAYDEFPRTGRALHRMNRARLCHSGCPSLISKDIYSVAADRLAKQIADREAEEGLTPELQAYLSMSEALLEELDDDRQPELLLEPEEGAEVKRMGLIVSRMEFVDFEALPYDSVNSWYKIESPVDDLAASEQPEDEVRFRHYAQLLDCKSQRIGWGAAQVGTSNVAYVVAVFDHVVIDPEDPLAVVPHRVKDAIYE